MLVRKPKRANLVVPRRYQPPHIPMAAIRRYARQIAERFNPDKIILFGSFAYGAPHEDSDVDLLVVMSAARAITQAIRIRLALPAPFSMDLPVRTRRKTTTLFGGRQSVPARDYGKRRVLYEKRDQSLGTKGRSRLAKRSPSGNRQAAGSWHYRIETGSWNSNR